MYTNASAAIQVNNTLGKPFKVTRGVAQGCVLSPLFFNIYLDDLLNTFREWSRSPCWIYFIKLILFCRWLGINRARQNTIKKYLEILKKWCRDNFFHINTDKSGILSIGCVDLNPNSEFFWNGKALKNLSKIKYLGFDITNNGSWDDNIKRLTQKSIGILARYCTRYCGRYEQTRKRMRMFSRS
jgi:hypothetical protein